MNAHHLKLIAIALVFFGLNVKAQVYPNKEFTDPKVYTPPTPEAASLFKFSEFPIDHASGSVTTSIPIFTANSGRIKVPVSLSYTSSGNRVQDIASSVGLGWNLNFGYSLSVTEEEPKPFPIESKIYKNEIAALAATNLNTDWVNEMKRSADGYYQTMVPMYRYRCGEFSGIFYYDINNNLRHIGRMLNVKIEKLNSSSVDYTGFKIITNDGLEYVFDKKESTMRLSQQNALGPQRTAFLCSRITDLLTNDAVVFSYDQKPAYTIYNESSTLRYWHSPSQQQTGEEYWMPQSDPYNVTMYDVNSWTISRIDFNDGYAVFDIATDRLDINPTRIKGVSIYSSAMGNVMINKVDFVQSYFQTSGGSQPKYNYRLKLDGITFNSINYPSQTPVEKYSFNYSSILLPPYRVDFNNRVRNASGVDYWGFYNGNSGGNTFIPIDIKNEFKSYYPATTPDWGIDRKANPNFTQACILTKVKYPTGGIAAFEYENHKLPGYYLGEYLGGVRISNIKYFESETALVPSIQKSFNYLSTKALTPAGMHMFAYLTFKSKAIENTPPYPTISATVFAYGVGVISSDPLYSIAYHNGSPLFYDEVEEFDGTRESNNGKTKYVFRYDDPYYYPTNFKDLGGKKLMPEDWNRGQLLRKEVYKKTNNASILYEKVYQEVNTVASIGSDFPWFENIVGFGVRKNDRYDYDHDVPGSWDIVGELADSFYENFASRGKIPRGAFIYNDFYSRIGSQPAIVKREISTFFNGQEKKDVTKYLYESPKHKQLSGIVTIDSKGTIRSKKYKYVQDKDSITVVDFIESSSAFKNLEYFNKYDDIIEEQSFIGDTLIEMKRDRYRNRYNSEVGHNVPIVGMKEFTSFANQSSDLSTLDIKAYNDKLKVLTVQKKKGIPISYIWDDYNTNLIAEVKNAEYSDIRYTSFEGGSLDRWKISSSRTFASFVPTGDYMYNLNSTNSLSTSGLNSATTYIVSYWSKNDSYSIPGSISIKKGASLGNWTYHEHLVTGQVNINISGSGAIDELRVYPKGSQMITYTHKPFSGVNSVTDEKNKISKYKYDGYRRLNQIVDQNGNIIKSFDYNNRY